KGSVPSTSRGLAPRTLEKRRKRSGHRKISKKRNSDSSRSKCYRSGGRRAQRDGDGRRTRRSLRLGPAAPTSSQNRPSDRQVVLHSGGAQKNHRRGPGANRNHGGHVQ